MPTPKSGPAATPRNASRKRKVLFDKRFVTSPTGGLAEDSGGPTIAAAGKACQVDSAGRAAVTIWQIFFPPVGPLPTVSADGDIPAVGTGRPAP